MLYFVFVFDDCVELPLETTMCVPSVQTAGAMSVTDAQLMTDQQPGNEETIMEMDK